jgi:hypothetical protein
MFGNDAKLPRTVSSCCAAGLARDASANHSGSACQAQGQARRRWRKNKL